MPVLADMIMVMVPPIVLLRQALDYGNGSGNARHERRDSVVVLVAVVGAVLMIAALSLQKGVPAVALVIQGACSSRSRAGTTSM